MLQELMKVTETNNKLDQISKVYQMSKLGQILKLDLISKVYRDWQQKTNNLVEPSFTVVSPILKIRDVSQSIW